MAGTTKDYMGYGTLSGRPGTPAITAVTGGSAFYYATDKKATYAWDGSAWKMVAGWAVQLDYALASDVSGLSIPTGGWTDVIVNQSFTVDDANSLVLVTIEGIGIYTSGSSGDEMGLQVVIDSAGTPITKPCGGAIAPNTGGVLNCSCVAHGVMRITGLTAASHTVKIQAQPSAATGTLNFRASTKPIYEHLSIGVVEHK